MLFLTIVFILLSVCDELIKSCSIYTYPNSSLFSTLFTSVDLMYCHTVTPSNFIDKLKCAICNNYLSHFPIYINKNQQNVCGRCAIKPAAIYVKNNIYEIIAEEVEFPCRFVEKGCIKRFLPRNIPEHEKQCPFRTIDCPTKKITGCSIIVPLPRLKQHCENHHFDVLLGDGKFQIELWKNEEVFRLLQNEGCISEFTWKYDLATRRLRCTISLLYYAHEVMSYFYSIVLKNENRTLTLTGSLGETISKSDIHKVGLDCLIDSSFYTDVIDGYVYIDTEKVPPQTRPVDQNILDLFRCVTCQNYIKPPVSIYLSGQSKCGSCGSGTLIRNNSLDKIGSLISYPCEFSKNGCKFIARPVVMQNHESYCAYKYQNCPINEYQSCSWTGFGKDINQHILENHEAIIKTCPEISENVANFVTKCYVVRYSNNFFRLIFCYYGDYYWTVQMIGDFEKNLKFEVEVLDGNNNNNKLVNRQNCLALTNKDLVFQNVNNYCYFTHDQIKHLISAAKKLKYRIHIFK